MFFDKETEMIVYGVPVHADHYEYPNNDECNNFIYPSASASYSYSYPMEDEDFCDIITELAQGEECDFMNGPSAVALPVNLSTDSDHQQAIPTVSFAVPEICVSAYDGKELEFIPAKVVDSMEMEHSDEFLIREYL